MAGANSIFDGDKLLTTPNNDRNEDMQVGGGYQICSFRFECGSRGPSRDCN